jgi:hypothetical protein
MADDQQIKAPDQVAAGGTPPARDNASAIDALRSRGPLPQTALNNIMQPPMGGGFMGMGMPMAPPPSMPANLGLAAGAGMLSGLAGHPTQNAYLTQHTEQQDADYKRQQDTQRMMERMQAQREKQSEAAMHLSDGLLESDNPEAQQAGARNKSALTKALYGFDAPPDYWIKRKDLKEGDRKDIDNLILAEVPDAEISSRYKNIPPGYLQTQRRALQNPQYRKQVTGMTPEEEKVKTNETRATLAHQESVRDAQARINAGQGTVQDHVLVDPKLDSPQKVGQWAMVHYAGQEVPEALRPFVEAEKQRMMMTGVTSKVQLAIKRNGGDLNKAWQDLQSDKSRRIPRHEFEFSLRLEAQEIRARGAKGVLGARDAQRLAAIEDQLSGTDKSTETISKNSVTINDAIAPGLQASINELATRLPRDSSPTVDLHDGNPPVLKSKLLREMWRRDHPDQDIEIQWTGKQWTPVRLWDLKKTTKGRPARLGTVLNPADESDDSDDGG